MRRFLLPALLVGLFWPPPALGQLDPKLDTPYRLRVVLHFARHRLLTPVFQQQVETQLGALLRLNFGRLAEVEVTRSHPLLADVEAKGLQEALGGWDDVSEDRTHFLLVGYADGVYRVRSLCHDGATGLIPPQARDLSTADRRQLARLAARAVDQDFGLTGTVVEAGEDTAHLAIQGGGLGVPLGRWLTPGDVFAVCRVQPAGPQRSRAELVEWAALQVQEAPDKGVCSCRYYRRYEQDRLTLIPGQPGGFRCLKLSTETAPLTLQLVAEEPGRPLDMLQVHVGRKGFDDRVQEYAVGPEGVIRTREAFADLALVRVVSGTSVLAQFPVPVVGPRVVTCRLSVDPATVSQGRLQLRHNRWLRRLFDDLSVTADRVAVLNDKLKESPEAALELARFGHEAMGRELERLRQEQKELARAAEEGKAHLDFTHGQGLLEDLASRRGELANFITRLEEAVKEGARNRRLQTRIEEARLLEAGHKYGAAIDLYKQVLEESPDQGKVREHVAKLEKGWQTRGEKHEKARAFVYEVWPEKADTAELKERVGQAREALETCQQAGDRLTPRRMLPATLAHAAYLKSRLEVLGRSANTEDNRAETRLIGTLAEDLQRLYDEALAWVKEPQ